MTYDLYIGDQTFSSWSLRGWLMLESFGLPFRTHMIGLYSGKMAEDMVPLAPAKLVPVLRLPDGTIVGESLAMAETLAERHPEAGLWPNDSSARATARWLCAEMCTSFLSLRGACPMNLSHVYPDFPADDGVVADLKRIETLWDHAAFVATKGDWLFGDWSLADVFFAPVAARIIGYNLPVSESARAYCHRMISHPAFLAWRAEGLKVAYDPAPYQLDLETAPWPV